jgi:hypothetical protein
LGLFTHACKQLLLYLRVLVSGSQLAKERHKGKEQADMNFYWTRLWHRLRRKFAERRWVPGKEDIMAKLIKFYVPANFHPKKQWTPEELRGKIIDFPAHASRKSA